MNPFEAARLYAGLTIRDVAIGLDVSKTLIESAEAGSLLDAPDELIWYYIKKCEQTNQIPRGRIVALTPHFHLNWSYQGFSKAYYDAQRLYRRTNKHYFIRPVRSKYPQHMHPHLAWRSSFLGPKLDVYAKILALPVGLILDYEQGIEREMPLDLRDALYEVGVREFNLLRLDRLVEQWLMKNPKLISSYLSQRYRPPTELV